LLEREQLTKLRDDRFSFLPSHFPSSIATIRSTRRVIAARGEFPSAGSGVLEYLGGGEVAFFLSLDPVHPLELGLLLPVAQVEPRVRLSQR
jgi:hypothetical protein